MGSGYVMNDYVFRLVTKANKPRYLEILGKDFLIDIYGNMQYEDYLTRNRIRAELVHKLVRKDFEEKFGKNYPFKVDIIDVNGGYKVGFFK